ncbi:hypothetical protein MCUN1_002920 [Malassezia cuniculi]|uniref:FAS1 domain-containing protein n=1 Tax=Malassezia cuniculi TaxID=948313 RepID=A0AAF0EWY0_9BASI|nr:hypothetical protein MCUN1_002920 [Malassezia cuniculi]
MRPCAVWLLALVGATVHAASTNLLDSLAQMPEHSTFVHMLQRTRLVPTLNVLEEKANLTIFAPTNDAFAAEPHWEALLAESNQLVLALDDVEPHDNVAIAARQRLLYHMLNYTLSDIPRLSMHETLYFPARHSIHAPPTEDRGMLLGGAGQVIRLAKRRNAFSREDTYVGVDAHGRGGARVVAVHDVPGGTIMSIDRVVSVPPPLAQLVETSGVASIFSQLADDALSALSATPHLTLFLPKEGALGELSPLEHAYITGPSREAAEDRVKLLAWHASSLGTGDGRVAYAENLRAADTVLTTILGGRVNVSQHGSRIAIGGASVVSEDILMQNGVLHIVDKLHLPFGDLGLSLAKMLMALNATSFVREMERADLLHYINQDPHESDPEPITLIVPPNDALDDVENAHRRDTLLYHILPGMHTPESIRDGGLVDSALVPKSLGRAQPVPTWVSDAPALHSIAFGATSVVQGPIKAGNSLIYLVDDMLQPPSKLLRTMASFGTLSTFTAALVNSGYDRRLAERRGALLVPDDEAFRRLGLTAKYLALPSASSRADLDAVLRLHTLPLLYAGQVRPEWTEVQTSNGAVQIKRPPRSQMSIRVGQTAAKAVRENVLTDSGVIHVVDRVLLPTDFEMSVEKLLQGAEATIMPALVREAGFGWIFDDESKSRYVLLSPTDSSFAKLNLTALRQDTDALRNLVALHILPLESHVPLKLGDGDTYPSLLEGDYGTLALRRLPGDGYMIGIRGSRGIANEHHYAAICDIGWTTGVSDAVAGILVIDTVLYPYMPHWYNGYRWLAVLGTVSIAAVIAAACCILYYRRRTYERVSTTLEGEEE